MGSEKTLILIDGHALAFRQYYALERSNMQTSEKVPSWAVFGFFKAIFDLLRDKNIAPDAIAVAFDVGRQTFRVEKYKEYKANREAMPDALKIQMGLIFEGLKAFNIPIYTKEGFEADDVIGTIVTKATKLGHKTLILTGDQDSFQLVDSQGKVKILIPTMGTLKTYGWREVYEKLGVYPDQVVDYKALRGDTSDNIPGVRGIGEKTAQMLLSRYGHLDELLSHCTEIPENAVRQRICDGKDIAKLSYELATIIKDVDIDFDFQKTKVEMPDIEKVREFLQKMQFYRFVSDIDKILETFNKGTKSEAKSELSVNSLPATSGEQVQLGLFSQMIKENQSKNCLEYATKSISLPEELESLVETLKNLGGFAFTLEVKVVNPIDIEIEKIRIAYESEGVKVVNLDCSDEILKTMSRLFEDENIKKTTYDAKLNYNALRANGITLAGVDFDVLLASYLKDPSRKNDLGVQAFENIGRIAEIDNSDEALMILELTKYWKEKLSEDEKKLLYETELPLTFVLAKMEEYGVKLNVECLEELSKTFVNRMKTAEVKIFELAGEGFNINSAKKLNEILFEKLNIVSKKRTKGRKNLSTNAEVLESLAENYPIAAYILEYRKNFKLKSTYTDALPVLISDIDGRIHTTFNQALTTTGRLSSSNPNLQNIPIRTPEGTKIRQAFITSNRSNSVILSADYSQVELRLLAHISGDEHLINAFKSGEDVHAITASKVFGVPLNKVTKGMRIKAKTVNFGIIYGQSKYGLAKSLGITNNEADDFINKYFQTYPKVKDYMKNTVNFAMEHGYVQTIFGRRRYLKTELQSPNYSIREFAQRAAINQPLQGTAADLIKTAMINLDKKLAENKLESKMILQVHDELVLEVKMSELEKVKKLVKDCMENVYPLAIPLTVDLNWGQSWKE